MKLQWLATIAALGFITASGQIASAADMAVKAPIAPPAPAAGSGYFEIYGGGAWSKDSLEFPFFTSDDRFHGWVLGGAGRASWWATPMVSLQLDLQAEATRYSLPASGTGFFSGAASGHFSTLSFLAGGHANLRDARTGLFGVFGGVGATHGNGDTAPLFFGNNGARHGVVGLEGQYYFSALTLYGQGGYDASFSQDNDSIFNGAHAWFVRGTARYFLDQNLMIEGTGLYANGAVAFRDFFGVALPDNNFNTWLWRAKLEWRPPAWPVSLFATYEGSRTHYDSNAFFGFTSERVTDNRVMGGIRLYLGQDTLFANDRNGTTLDIIDPLGTPTSPVMLQPTGFVPIVSDARLKRDVALIGRRNDGLGLYRYRYLWSDTVYVGVMAQEVALIHPDAVVHGFDGFLRVDYPRLGLRLMTLPQWEATHGARS
jgi:hypothetical protein